LDLSKYPLETQARAALRLTASWLAKAQLGPRDGATDEQEARRKSLLQVHPAVQAIADRCVFEVDDDGNDRRPGYIAGLLRIARVSPEEFAVECGTVDAGERAVFFEARMFMAGLPESTRPQRSASRYDVPSYGPTLWVHAAHVLPRIVEVADVCQWPDEADFLGDLSDPPESESVLV
jgi:hypothetical protein